MKKIAVLFAGQGSQYIGMGQDFYNAFDEVKSLYKEASSILGYDLTKICFSENELIHQTEYTQPCILVTSLAIYEVLKNKYQIKPHVVAGFSLGEYSALHASGVFNYQQILYLIKRRAALMSEAAKNRPGKMAAIIGLDQESLKAICEKISNNTGIVQIANYNCPNQLVIGGKEDAVVEACNEAKEQGAKRAIVLNVSGGFHTKLMEEAAQAMYDEIVNTSFKEPHTDIVMNHDANYLDIQRLPDLMKRQIESSVYFEDTLRLMIKDGVDTFIEVGPGNVLSGFVKKIDRSVKVTSIDKLSDLE